VSCAKEAGDAGNGADSRGDVLMGRMGREEAEKIVVFVRRK